MSRSSQDVQKVMETGLLLLLGPSMTPGPSQQHVHHQNTTIAQSSPGLLQPTLNPSPWLLPGDGEESWAGNMWGRRCSMGRRELGVGMQTSLATTSWSHQLGLGA